MNEMFERVKRAVFVAAADRWCDWPTPDHPECVKIASTVLQAMREPTEAMTHAAFDAVIIAVGQPEHCWKAMIDAALKEKPE